MALEPTAHPDILARYSAVLRPRFRLIDLIRKIFPFFFGPSITSFDPIFGPPGTLITIEGARFSSVREHNSATVGGVPAFVLSASPTRLVVLTSLGTNDGAVKVRVNGRTATGPVDFDVRGYDAGEDEDGPPISFLGAGDGSAGDVNPIGTVRVLVALVCPSNLTPTAAARTTVQTAWDNVHTYYDQASYGKTDVQVDITTNWHTLDGTTADFVDPAIANIRISKLGALMAQAAQGAVDEGLNLDDYAMMAAVVFLNGSFIRAWGGWSQQNFSYNNGLPAPNTININLTASHQINLIAIQETANWGRCAHEFGHNVVSAPNFMGDGTATLGEDVYGSDLVDPAAATVQNFELMGNHDSHPLFSGYHLDKLGYYDPGKIQQLIWNGTTFSQDFDIVAHGLGQDPTAGRFHLIKIAIGAGLHYYVQVRQRPGATTQLFDDSIPLGGAPNQGGVIVSSAIADVLHNNQQTRFLTLLHPDKVLKQGDVVEDPARALKIRVVNGAVATNPLVCKVRVEWATMAPGDPTGTFDLQIEPWGSNWQTPDIWIDRAPFGTFDNPLDANGRPQGNGDRPRPMEVNHFIGRIHVTGASGASNVPITFYSVFPPGVGDNGNWTPLATRTVNIAANSFTDAQVNWVPVVGQHTCLRVYASQQAGEITGGNNFAQENVGDFEAPAMSPPQPATIKVAVRNPLETRALIKLDVKGVPQGWAAHFPHSWVWLDGRAEKHFDLTIIPMFDYAAYRERKIPMTAAARIDGFLTRIYETPLANDEPPGSRCFPIGGYTGRVHVRKGASIRLAEARERQSEATVRLVGLVSPAADRQRIIVTLTDPKGRGRKLQVYTVADGTFAAEFDLGFEPSLESDQELWKRSQGVLSGTYVGRAAIVAATQLAEAQSNVVYLKR